MQVRAVLFQAEKKGVKSPIPIAFGSPLYAKSVAQTDKEPQKDIPREVTIFPL